MDAFDDYLRETPAEARPVLKRLRKAVHDANGDIAEAIKWGAPAFLKDGIVCSLHAFKNFVGVWFPKGTHIPDPKRLLQPGRTAHTMKVIRIPFGAKINLTAFTQLVREAIRLNERGVKVAPQKRPVVVPTPLRKALAASPKAKAFFDGLPPSHRREYAGYVAEAKRPETIARRVEKTIGELMRGRKPNEKYC